MSSLNEAFIKAYGRERSAPAETTAPPTPVTQPPAAPVLANWYNADTWYRAEGAAVQSSIPAPHFTQPGAYQAPTASDVSRLTPIGGFSAAGEVEYRLSPAEAAPAPEVIVEDEPEPLAPHALEATTPAAHPSAAVTPVVMAPAVSPDFEQLYASVQFSTGWESSLGYLPAVTTAGPVPVLAPAVSKPVAAPTAKPVTVSAPPSVANSPAEPKLIVAAPEPQAAPTVEKAKAPENIDRPRLDAAASPVPKPHTKFGAAESATTLKLKIAEASIAPTTQPEARPAPTPVEAPTAKPEPPPLGLVQPAWEVDRFQWPEHCRQLLSTENEYLADVGMRLSTAARDGLNILGVTSTRRGEGRTTLALCLARAAADAGVKVALVDCDIDNPQLVNELGVEASCGWHEVIQGKQPLSEAAIVSLEDKFAFFPWTSSTGVKSLNDPRATRALREIAKAYSLVILDLGPVPGRETKLFEDGENCPVDAAILVRDLRWTSALEAQRVAAQLTAAGVESVGIAENFGPRAQQAA